MNWEVSAIGKRGEPLCMHTLFTRRHHAAQLRAWSHELALSGCTHTLARGTKREEPALRRSWSVRCTGTRRSAGPCSVQPCKPPPSLCPPLSPPCIMWPSDSARGLHEGTINPSAAHDVALRRSRIACVSAESVGRQRLRGVPSWRRTQTWRCPSGSTSTSCASACSSP